MSSDAVRAIGAVIQRYGPAIIGQPDQLRGALADLIPDSPFLEAIVVAGASGIAQQAGTAPVTPAQVASWLEHLRTVGVPADQAQAAIMIWGQALGPADRASQIDQTARTLTAATDGVPPDSWPARPDAPTVVERYYPGGGDRTVEANWRDGTATDWSVHQAPPAEPSPAPPDRTRLRDFWPTVVAAVVAIAALAVGFPMALANSAPQDHPFEPVEIHSDLFDRRDLAQFTLTDTEVTTVVPGADDVFGAAAWLADPYSVGFSAADGTCSGLLTLTVPADESATPPYVSYAHQSTPWAWVDSMSRWYTSTEAASAALDTITRVDSSCQAPTIVDSNGTSFPARVEASSRRVGDVRVEELSMVAASTPAWNLNRTCYLAVNIVSCVTVSGTDITGSTRLPTWEGQPAGATWAQYLDWRLTQITPYRER